MIAALRRFWAEFVKGFGNWRRANLEAHRDGGQGDCCASPMQVYASRRGSEPTDDGERRTGSSA